ncbi:hypothetical protein CHU92_03110 [Flavobacterium cyanobacteriorum]|uniref:Peptidase M56 domain-containing protein n=1 Tax=Flavobacterium cyanobacteriorum TaxID=2022802 RepID=A0A255ZSC9_9FLAO|nr:M56 family metallopeptidase [Flavobacterium cyanobacteriorum]OYQ43630.1 hypothetical protein CHU92_03110 [Flavobacterium cyanobacteriorum]
MEHFILYLAKAAGLTSLFFIAYYLFLRKETFFTANRWFLMAGMATSALLPLVEYTRIVWVNPLPQQAHREIDINHLMMMQDRMAASPAAEATLNINWFDVVAGIYIAGVVFLLIRFLLDILSLKRMLTTNVIIKDGRYLLVDSPAIKTPFSFFNYIVYNASALRPDELESIISHEKVHSAQRHSVDMVAGQLFCIAFWFNPFAWAYKKSISQNLEFIADAVAVKQIADKEAYQKILLKITVQPECIAITNHFYQSLIKKRIVMLNKKQSKKRNSWKYAIVLPALAAFMLLFQVKVVAQEKEAPETKVVTKSKVKIAVEVNKDTKDEELQQGSKVFKEEFDADVNFQNITRNQKNEITAIKVTVKDKTQSKVYEVADTEPIAPFTVEMEKGSTTGKNSIIFGSPDRIRIAGAARLMREGDSLRGKRLLKSYTNTDDVIIVPPAPPAPGAPGMVPPPPPMQGNWSFNGMKIGDTDMLVVINGIKQKKGEPIKLPLDQEIDEINILKDKAAKKKYGKEGRDGAVEIITKRGGISMMMRYPQAFTYNIPEDGENGGFDIDKLILDLTDNLKEMQIYKYSDNMSPEELEDLQEKLYRSQAEIQKAMEEMQFGLSGDNLSREELNDVKKELREARKQMMESRKELMEARKEMMKAKEEASGEKAKAKAKKVVYKRA